MIAYFVSLLNLICFLCCRTPELVRCGREPRAGGGEREAGAGGGRGGQAAVQHQPGALHVQAHRQDQVIPKIFKDC